MDATFFDPALAELQRQLQSQLTTGLADLQLKDDRLVEDANLMRPWMERRFGRRMDQAAGDVAARGFHGNTSGIMRGQLTELGEEQAFSRGMFERDIARGRDDIARSAQQLTNTSTTSGAEGVRRGAANATQRQLRSLPF